VDRKRYLIPGKDPFADIYAGCNSVQWYGDVLGQHHCCDLSAGLVFESWVIPSAHRQDWVLKFVRTVAVNCDLYESYHGLLRCPLMLPGDKRAGVPSARTGCEILYITVVNKYHRNNGGLAAWML
jgi:hypothetical protein